MIASHLLGGRYRLEEPLGQGGMSVVWLAMDEVLSRPVAVKVLDEQGAGADPGRADGGRAAIRREAQSAARISHPNIASVFDFAEGEDPAGNPVAYLVMELLTGQPLAERLVEGDLTTASALTIAAEVAAALAAAHAHGLVHRDVKPGNIMLTPFGVKVFDFGIAARAGDPDEADEQGQILGTPMYVAPERLTGATVTAAADMYAFGVLLEQLLGDQLEDLPAVAQFQRRCLAEDPAQRPPAAEAADLLRSIVVPAPLPFSGSPPFPAPLAASEPLVSGGAVPSAQALVSGGAVPSAEALISGGAAPSAASPPAIAARSSSAAAPASESPSSRAAVPAAESLPATALLPSAESLPSTAVLPSAVAPASPSVGGTTTAPVPGGFPRGVASVRPAPAPAATTLMTLDAEAAPARRRPPAWTLGAAAVGLIGAGLAIVIAVAGAGTGDGATTDRPPPATTAATSRPPATTAAHSAAFPSAAASVTASCQGSQATITGYTLQPGFELHKANRGPATTVTAEFRSSGRGRPRTITYTITCRNGVPTARLGG